MDGEVPQVLGGGEEVHRRLGWEDWFGRVPHKREGCVVRLLVSGGHVGSVGEDHRDSSGVGGHIGIGVH